VKRAPVLCLTLAGAAGCATGRAPPPRDLLDARAELGGVQASPQAELAPAEIADADEALAEAERDVDARGRGELRPTRARTADDVYVARRMAQRARLAALYAADREALDHARGAVQRFAEDGRRREAFFTGLASRRRAEAEARVHTAAARRSALDLARGPTDEILDRPEGLLLRLSAEQLFLPGTSLLRTGAEARLAAVAAALRIEQACDVRVQVLDDVEGFHTDPASLARRRARRIRDALCDHGVPRDTFLAPLRNPPPGTQVDLLVVERPPVLPAERL
jgi:outer membrane protein OmpA-like peptidoglycan-associated protein